jgi:hypothetical protein
MSADPCRVLFDALEAADCQPRGPEYKFVARCPAHEDRLPSLSVGEGVDRRAVLFCHAGCDTEEVVRALGLSWADLFPPDHDRAPRYTRPRMVTERAIVSVARVLTAAGITYRHTATSDLIVADECPACRKPELWIHDDGERLRVSCWIAGCTSAEILAALSRSVTEVDRVAA